MNHNLGVRSRGGLGREGGVLFFRDTGTETKGAEMIPLVRRKGPHTLD